MTSTTAFWLIRHAPVAGPAGVIHAPDAPADLGDAGRLAALSASLPAGAVGYCSPARRTRQTAAALGLEVRLEPALREQDFGAWTGRRHDQIAGEDAARYEGFWQAPATNSAPGGESFVAQIVRVRAALDGIAASVAVLIVHSGTIRAALAVALEIDPARALSFVVDPLSLTRIDRIGNDWRIACVNAAR